MTLTLKWANGTCTGDLTQVASLVTAIAQKKPWTQTTRKPDGLTVWQKWDESEQLTSVGEHQCRRDAARKKAPPPIERLSRWLRHLVAIGGVPSGGVSGWGL